MSFDDELQRRFDTAGQAMELDDGSANAVMHRAARRTRNTRVLRLAAVALVVVAAGAVAFQALPDGTNNNELVEVGEPDTNRSGPITEDDLTYVGAFMLPAGDVGQSRFAYGGDAAAFNPFGDPDGTDTFTGSLFMSGHPIRSPGVAEVSIPAPASHNGTTVGLPVAEVLAPFADITNGRAQELVGQDRQYRYGGLEVVDGPGGARLHWTVWQYNNVTAAEVPGHGHSSLDVGAPDPQGPWFLDGYDNRLTPGYVFTVPEEFADQSLGGNRFVTGFKSGQTTTGRSWGPPFFAFTPPEGAPPQDRLPAVALALFQGEEQALAGHGRADLTGGAAWVTAQGGAEAVVTVGRRGLGTVRDGAGNPPVDCNNYSGVHGGPYEPQVMFFDPVDLAAVAAGDLEPWQVQPYRMWNPAEHLVASCEWELSSISFDQAAGLLYVVQTQADTSQDSYSPVPVVHVFSV